MAVIDGRIKILEPVVQIESKDKTYSYPMLIFAIEKQQNGKKLLIAFKVFGRLAEQISKMAVKTKLHITYSISSNKRGLYWSTDLILKNYELYDIYKAKKDEYINSYTEGNDSPVPRHIKEETTDLFTTDIQK